LRAEKFVTTNFRKDAVDLLLMLHQGLICLILVHGIFAYHDVHPFLHFVHKVFGALAFTKLDPELRERHLLVRPVDIVVHELSRGPTVRDRPDPGGDEFFDDVSAANMVLAR
jgi:hypothetical protein